MSYWTKGFVRLHLYSHWSNPSGENNYASIEGEHQFGYMSTSAYCGNFTSLIEKYSGGYTGWSIDYDPYMIRARLTEGLSPCTTQDVLDGKQFALSFHNCALYYVPAYDYYYSPTLVCKMNSAGDIEYTTATPGDWLGEECVGRVIITGVLH
jgi:hypothetical protein